MRVQSTAGEFGYPAGLGYVTVTNSLLSKIGVGLVIVAQYGGTGQITFSGCTINAESAGASNSGGTLLSAGNNLFVGNGSNVVGPLSHTTLQ